MEQHSEVLKMPNREDSATFMANAENPAVLLNDKNHRPIYPYDKDKHLVSSYNHQNRPVNPHHNHPTVSLHEHPSVRVEYTPRASGISGVSSKKEDPKCNPQDDPGENDLRQAAIEAMLLLRSNSEDSNESNQAHPPHPNQVQQHPQHPPPPQQRQTSSSLKDNGFIHRTKFYNFPPPHRDKFYASYSGNASNTAGVSNSTNANNTGYMYYGGDVRRENYSANQQGVYATYMQPTHPPKSLYHHPADLYANRHPYVHVSYH